MNEDNKELIEFLGEQFQHVDKKFQELDAKISQLPTKSYLDDKMADLEGGLVSKLRKEDDKVNRLSEMLRTKKVLTDIDMEELKKLQVFPR